MTLETVNVVFKHNKDSKIKFIVFCSAMLIFKRLICHTHVLHQETKIQKP